MSQLDTAQVVRLQEDLNYFSEHFLKGHAPLSVDGDAGPLTRRRTRIAKHQLGYDRLSQDWTVEQQRRLRHPKDPDLATAAVVARGIARRRAQRQAWFDDLQAAAQRSGVTRFDGTPCAKWLVPYLRWAREEGGWKGVLESGYRDPAFSERLCLEMCGQPKCPGRCAGRDSNHSGDAAPRGALDVTDWQRFGEAMRRCPLRPRIFNGVPTDPVHFSASGG